MLFIQMTRVKEPRHIVQVTLDHLLVHRLQSASTVNLVLVLQGEGPMQRLTGKRRCTTEPQP